MSTILVTGGAGYIGSHTCLELIQSGHEIIVIDNLSNSSEISIRRVEGLTGKAIKFYAVDLLDFQRLQQVFSNHTVDAVIHFAGFKAVGESVQIPLQYYHNNITGTLNLCDVMQQFNVKKLVFSSSATVYSPCETEAISEEFPLGASNPYGRTKLMIEHILQDLYVSDPKWKIILLRYFNPVGANPSGLIGEDPNGIPNNLLPYITQVAAGKLDKLKIFGNDYPTLDGTGIRDYIHVVDLAIGHLKAIARLEHLNEVGVYNLGTGKGYSVLEVVEAFEKVSGQRIPYIFTKRRPGDLAICYANPSKAQNELNWKAERGLDEMCADAWRWQMQNPDGYINTKS